MSVTVSYRIVKASRAVGKLGLKELLNKLYGDFPITLGDKDIGTLDTAMKCSEKNAAELEKLIDAINDNGDIEVFAEY